jgi:urease gamma subunit
MIQIKATVMGEPDALPVTKVFDYGSSDEEIFFSSSAMIEEKLRRGMKINANEALIIYCDYVVEAIRASVPDIGIAKSASKVLSADKVMIGVPETLQNITFEARIDTIPARKIIIKEPLQSSSYMMAG